jgi:hypothetical protein
MVVMGHNLAYLNEIDNCKGGMVQVAESSVHLRVSFPFFATETGRRRNQQLISKYPRTSLSQTIQIWADNGRSETLIHSTFIDSDA